MEQLANVVSAGVAAIERPLGRSTLTAQFRL